MNSQIYKKTIPLIKYIFMCMFTSSNRELNFISIQTIKPSTLLTFIDVSINRENRKTKYLNLLIEWIPITSPELEREHNAPLMPMISG